MGEERAPCILQPAPGLWGAGTPRGEKAIMLATEHEGIGGSSFKIRRTKNTYRHHNLSSKPHSGAFPALLIFWTISYLHYWLSGTPDPDLEMQKSLLFLVPPPLLQPTHRLQPINQPPMGLPKPIQAFVQVGRGASSSRHFTSTY